MTDWLSPNIITTKMGISCSCEATSSWLGVGAPPDIEMRWSIFAQIKKASYLRSMTSMVDLHMMQEFKMPSTTPEVLAFCLPIAEEPDLHLWLNGCAKHYDRDHMTG